MSLREPVERTPVHTRKVECQAFLRADDLWDIEGQIIDTRPYISDSQCRGPIAAGAPIHTMRARLTLDDKMHIHDAEAASIVNPYPICGDAAPRFASIIGLRIGPGWMKAVRERLGGTQCCTHIVELLGPIATVAYQSISIYRAHLHARSLPEGTVYTQFITPPMNGCYALSTERGVVREFWPDTYTGAE